MTFRRSFALALLLPALIAACASEGRMPANAPSTPALDVPPLFERGLADAGVRAETGACWNPMVDPRDGTSLRLVRSAEGRGDYEVPPGRYGVGEQQLLRLDCASGRTIGVVPR